MIETTVLPTLPALPFARHSWESSKRLFVTCTHCRCSVDGWRARLECPGFVGYHIWEIDEAAGGNQPVVFRSIFDDPRIGPIIDEAAKSMIQRSTPIDPRPT